MRWIGVCLFLTSCGYHYKEQSSFSCEKLSISVPYILGDPDGLLNNELVYQLSASSGFVPVQQGGDLVLQVVFLSDTKEPIGFRYDRDNAAGHLEKNILGVEDRRTAILEVSLLHATSGRVILGPNKISAFADYDYTDPGSPRDLLFARKEPVMQFSLGQLDSYEGAHDDSARPLFRKVAQKIVTGLVSKIPEIAADF